MNRARMILQLITEKAAPGFEGSVLAMKKHKKISNPWALSWYLKNTVHAKSHYTKSGKHK